MDDEGGDVENQYYKAKCTLFAAAVPLLLANCSALKEDDPDGAIKAFRAIVDDQTEKGEWYVHSPVPDLTVQGVQGAQANDQNELPVPPPPRRRAQDLPRASGVHQGELIICRSS